MPEQRWIRATSVTYTTAQGSNLRPSTPKPPWFHCSTVGTPTLVWQVPSHNSINFQYRSFLFYFICLFVLLCRAACVAYGDSQARGLIRAVAAGLHHCHSNTAMYQKQTILCIMQIILTIISLKKGQSICHSRKNITGIPVVAQQVKIQLRSMRMRVWPLVSLIG